MTAALYDQNGYYIRDLPYSFKRSWILNAYGTCSWKMPVQDFSRDFEFGKYIVLDHPTLGKWGGVIDQPREWDNKGIVTVKAYSAEYILKFRRGDAEQTNGGSAGVLFLLLLQLANGKYPTLISSQDIYYGGDTLAQLTNVTDIYSQVLQLAQDSGCDFDVYPVIANNQLTFKANWYKKIGMKINDPNAVLIPGKNIDINSPALIEQGDIYNDYLAYGNGDTWSDRPVYFVNDNKSQSDYGVRQAPGLSVDGTTPDQLSTAALSALTKSINPRRTFNISALDKGNLFTYCRKGNILLLEMDNVGWHNGKLGTEAWVRIKGLDYDDDEKVCGLIAEEEI
jgi:hypothetical protein